MNPREAQKTIVTTLLEKFDLVACFDILNTKSVVFDDMTPMQFAFEAGWEETLNQFVRIYGWDTRNVHLPSIKSSSAVPEGEAVILNHEGKEIGRIINLQHQGGSNEE
jgi:hypothetical protein